MRVTVAFAGPSQESVSEFDEDLGAEVDRSGVTHPEGARYRAFEVRGDGAIAPVLRSPEEAAAAEARLAPPPAPAHEAAPPARPAGPTPLSDRPGAAARGAGDPPPERNPPGQGRAPAAPKEDPCPTSATRSSSPTTRPPTIRTP